MSRRKLRPGEHPRRGSNGRAASRRGVKDTPQVAGVDVRDLPLRSSSCSGARVPALEAADAHRVRVVRDVSYLEGTKWTTTRTSWISTCRGAPECAGDRVMLYGGALMAGDKSENAFGQVAGSLRRILRHVARPTIACLTCRHASAHVQDAAASLALGQSVITGGPTAAWRRSPVLSSDDTRPVPHHFSIARSAVDRANSYLAAYMAARSVTSAALRPGQRVLLGRTHGRRRIARQRVRGERIDKSADRRLPGAPPAARGAANADSLRRRR